MPDGNVMRFLEGLDARQMFVSVLTVGELRKGAEARRGKDPVAADRLAAWLEAMETEYGDRVIPVNSAVAVLWGRLSANSTAAESSTPS